MFGRYDRPGKRFEPSAVVRLGGTERYLLLNDKADIELFNVFDALEPRVEANCRAGDWTAALKSLSATKPAVDRFFDDVMVMVDDAQIRANRLALLRRVSKTMNRVADISKLAT